MAEDNKFEDESTDFYDEFKERMRQEPLKSVLDKRARQSRPVAGVITVLAGVFVTAAVLWYAIERISSSGEDIAEDGQIPVIKAETSPVKVKPEEAGGMPISGQDKYVYGRIGKTADAEPEKLLQGAEKPEPVDEAEEAVEIMQPTLEVDDKVIVVKETSYTPPVTPAPAPAAKAVEPPAKAVEPTTPAAIAKITRPEPEPEPVPLYQPPAANTADTGIKSINPPPASAVKPAKNSWKVQVLSSKQRDLVEKSYSDMKRKVPELVEGLSHEIMEADLGSKGVFFRLRIGSFSDRAAADELCRKLKAKKYDCIVVK